MLINPSMKEKERKEGRMDLNPTTVPHPMMKTISWSIVEKSLKYASIRTYLSLLPSLLATTINWKLKLKYNSW